MRVGHDSIEGLEGLRVKDQTRDAQKSREGVACRTSGLFTDKEMQERTYRIFLLLE